MFQPSKDHPQGVRLIHFIFKFNKMSHQMYGNTLNAEDGPRSVTAI
jgi:hypothetical protein